jgi:hypothetical protein
MQKASQTRCLTLFPPGAGVVEDLSVLGTVTFAGKRYLVAYTELYAFTYMQMRLSQSLDVSDIGSRSMH